MSEEKARAIAESADMVLNGYAVTRDGTNFRVVNLRTGAAAYVLGNGDLSETDMDDVESGIAMRIISENRRYLSEVSQCGFYGEQRK